MSTKSKKHDGIETSAIQAADVLREQEEIKIRAIAESGLYRKIVKSAANGQASADDAQAAKILATKWGWEYDSDVAASAELTAIESEFTDFAQALKDSWHAVEVMAALIEKHKIDAATKLKEMESERQRLVGENRRIGHLRSRHVDIQKQLPHLVEVQ
ncbi:MAG TPA: hypothetical protein PKD64_08735 [Pirellulaceae bacterium]|nr:hypothetical protein [Pirellulaceae bacterium]HMO92273.1 hypothetical protein [Pirellulaceae bacterium]HMP70091.1 hypothetical protein [Pirellulaceae bacterium]